MSISQLKMMTSKYDRYCRTKRDFFQDRNYERVQRPYPNSSNVARSFLHTRIVNQSKGSNSKHDLGSDYVNHCENANNIKSNTCSISRNNVWESGSRRRLQVIPSSLKNKVFVIVNRFIESERNIVCINSGT